MRQQHDFTYWWNTSGPWVEEPNVRRSGTSGVQRVVHEGKTVYVKRQTGHLFRSLRYPLGRPTVLREGRALSKLLQLGVLAPNPIFYNARKVKGVWQGILVTKDLNGFQDLDTWYAGGGRSGLTDAEHLKVLERLATLLSRLHLGRWQHGCMRSKHIFIKVLTTADGFDVELALLDLEKSHGRATSLGAARHDIPQLRRHSPWSDGEWRSFLACYEQGLGRPLASDAR
ncbi:lipopolysaccharide kinase InaA family protein [Pseudomonas sp. SZMC_28357]|uniref:lipopolysaccharide kinase InaA family protein n=1 Tax=Pseudomonas sp. SZMC_28357 TaxID=3074380 RepID=UPI0028722165|nr:lipopolysaccharide kinase InaA family protein [Pseudomonas sp. SZMC_28357]MDR9751506.1 lipopolysaccharide kinase InaA family protein [Pseudomonas sp. SZMC_28357]